MYFITKDKRFTSVEDNIIKTMKNTPLFKELVQKCGKKNVDEREAFLKISK